MKETKKKIKSKAGETLVETLVAVLVGSMALLILATLINYSSKAIRESESKMNAYYTEANRLESFDGTSSSSKARFTDSSNNSIKLTDSDPKERSLRYYKNSESKSIDIYSYK